MADDTGLLLACLRRGAHEVKVAQLRGYTSEDWEAMLKTAVQHRVGPVVYHSLKPLCADLNIPEHILQKLRNIYYASAARNVRLYQELMQTLGLLKREGIAVILLKGAYLAEAVYGNIALRPMTDVDLLAQRGDLARLHDLLISDEYFIKEQSCMSNPKHLAPYHKKNGVCCLEIHLQIVDPPYAERIEMQQLWDRAQGELLQGVEVVTLSPEDLFLHLCLHSCIQHGFDNGLISVLDTAFMLERYEGKMDWEQLWGRAQEWGIERSVYLMLALAEKMLGVPMPEHVRRGMKVERQVLAVLAAAEDLMFQRSKGTTRYLARLFGPQGWRTKLQYLKQRSFPPRETLYRGEQQLAGKGFEQYFYYISRVRLLLKRHGKTLWLGLRKNPQTLIALELENKKNDLRDWLDSY